MATKRLARQLGIIRSSSKTSLSGQRHSRPKLRQLFDYLIVIDFESTCWNDGRKHYRQEIIEFPAVLLNASDGEIESEFHMYVQPQEHPILSEFCTELTGINQNQVDEGVPLHICLSQFSKWIQKIQKEKKIVFYSASSSCATSEGKLCTFVTWSDSQDVELCAQCTQLGVVRRNHHLDKLTHQHSTNWDLGVCLQYECKRKQLRKPDILNSWIDLRATYKLFYCRKPQGLNGALQEVGILFEGREHSGLDDSRNTARLAWRMICDGCVMKITKSLDKALPAQKSIASFLSAKPTEGSPLGSDGGAKTSCLDESWPSEVSAAIKNDNGEQPPEWMSVRLGGNLRVTSRSCKKADVYGGVPSCLTPCPGNLRSPLGGLQPSYSHSLAGIQNRLKNEHLTSNFSACHTGLVLVSTTLSSVNISDTELSTTSDCLSMLADWEDVALIPDSQHNPSSEFLPTDEGSNKPSPLTFGDAEGGNGPHVANLGSESVERASLNAELSNKSVLFKSPTTTVYDNVTAPSKFTNPLVFKLPTTKAMTPSAGVLKTNCVASSSVTHKRKPSSPTSFPPAKKPPFLVYEDKTTTSKNSLSFRSLGTRRVLSGALNSSINLNRSVDNQRVTPPLCQCGRRARRLHVSNGGPNHGKAFYSCPAGKQEGNGKGCGYFKWEHALLKEKRALPSPPSVAGLQSRHTSSRSSGHPPSKPLSLRPSMRT